MKCVSSRAFQAAVVAAAIAGAGANGASAQTCVPGFGAGEPGSSGIADPFSAYVQPMVWFDSKLVLGGAFSTAGPLATNILAAFDPVTGVWSRVGGNVNLGNTNGYAAALASFPIDGVNNLILGGFFTNVRNGAFNVTNTASLARWDGQLWREIGTGWNASNRGSVWSLLDWQPPGGPRQLVAGGGWASIGGATADGIAFYDGESWNNIGGPNTAGIGGTFSPTVFAMTVFNNQLYIGGRFDSTNGVATPLIARWNGTAWQRPGAIAARGAVSDVSSFAVFNDGTGAKLYAGGYDMAVGGQSTSIAAFNGVVWTRIGQNLGGRCTSLAVFDDGTGEKLYCGLTADAQERYFYRLEGNTWVPVGGGVSFPITGNFPSVFGLLVHEESLFVGGNFQVAGTQPSYGIARYGGCATPPCAPDFNGDGLLNPDDLADFISCFFAAPPCAGADFNGDATADPDDLADFITAFFLGC